MFSLVIEKFKYFKFKGKATMLIQQQLHCLWI